MEKKTKLIVDDDESQRFLWLEVLTHEGYKVMLAKNGKEALIISEESPPGPGDTRHRDAGNGRLGNPAEAATQ